jgi:hypothetical protein
LWLRVVEVAAGTQTQLDQEVEVQVVSELAQDYL